MGRNVDITVSCTARNYMGPCFFFFFRLFDIFKPGPVQVMDDMDDSIGVMMDDVVAGILACLVTQSLLYFYQ